MAAITRSTTTARRGVDITTGGGQAADSLSGTTKGTEEEDKSLGRSVRVDMECGGSEKGPQEGLSVVWCVGAVSGRGPCTLCGSVPPAAGIDSPEYV